jgi:tRNA pseudouridine13 synthase
MVTRLNLPVWRKAYPDIPWEAKYKTSNQDFLVTEELSFELNHDNESGSQQLEHLYLYIQKTSLTSYQLVELLADYFDIEQSRVGYAGLKDKKAITKQWFSVYLPGKFKSLDIEMLIGSQMVTATNSVRYSGQCEILKAQWYSGKIRRGAIARNQFKITLRSKTKIPPAVFERLESISKMGFPNYFSEQRFGIEGQNIKLIDSWVKNKTIPEPKLHSILFSAARSRLFNNILNSRIESENWNQAIAGDYYMLNGTNTCFEVKSLDHNISERCKSGDIHPCASLWGVGNPKILAEAGEIESQCLRQFKSWCQFLEEKQLKIAYRSMRCLVQNLHWQSLNNTDLELNFALPSGSYATALLHELGIVTESHLD